MKKLYILLFLIFTFSLFCNAQNIRYGEIFSADYLKGKVDPNDIVECEKYFQLKDSLPVVFGDPNYDKWPEIIGGLDTIGMLFPYPEIFKKHKISGRIFLEFLLDKQGNIKCYRIHSCFSESINKLIESNINRIKFSPVFKNGKYLPSEYFLPVNFKYEAEKKKNR